MTASAHRTVAQAIVAALSQAPAVSAVVDLNRRRPMQAASGIVVSQRSAEADAGGPVGLIVWRSLIDVTAYAAGASADADADALMTAAWQRLAALDPASVGAMAITAEASAIAWDFENLGEREAAIGFSLTVLHATRAADIGATAP